MNNWPDNSGYTQVETYPSGNYKSFVPLVETQWQFGAVEIQLCADHKVQFYENGNLKSFTLFQSATIQCHGVAVTAQGETLMECYEDGSIKQLTVGPQDNGYFRSKNWIYKGKEFAPGTRIRFSLQGLIES